MESNQKAAGGGWQSRDSSAPPTGITPVFPTTCWLCTILSKSGHTDSTVYNDIKTMKFRSSHRPYHSRYTNTYSIHPDNCLQWLNTSVKNRISALDKSKTRQLCHICLSIPVSWNKARSGCDGAHSLRKRASDRHASQLCVVPTCPYHYTICSIHTEQNKAHPLICFPNKWLTTVFAANPALSKETIMLLPVGFDR